MIIFSIILFFLLGFSVLNLISDQFSIGEKIGYSMLIGLPLATFIFFVLSLLKVRVTAELLIYLSLTLIIIINIINFKSLRSLITNIKKTNFSGTNFRSYNMVWLGLLLVAGYIVYGITCKNLYWPAFAFDSVAGYDLMAKVSASEGTILNSLFDENGRAIDGSAHRIIYPPNVPVSMAIAYLNGLELPKIIISLFYIFFLISLYFISIRYNTKTGGAIIIFITVITPEFTAHASLAMTNMPQAIYVGLGYIALWIWITNNDNKYLVLSAVFLAFNTWTRTEGILFSFVAGLVVLYYTVRNKQYMRLIVFSLIVLAPYIIWNGFLFTYNIKAAVPQQRLLVDHLFWDYDKMARLFSNLNVIFFKTTVFYGAILYMFFGMLLLNSVNIYRKAQLPFLFLIFFSWLLYIFFYYQIDYSWDSLDNVIQSSYKRFFFCFIPLMAFYIASNKFSRDLLYKFEDYITLKNLE